MPQQSLLNTGDISLESQIYFFTIQHGGPHISPFEFLLWKGKKYLYLATILLPVTFRS